MTPKTNRLGLRHGNPHAQIHLPPLSAHEALLFSNLLDRTIAALWRTHGDAMAALLDDDDSTGVPAGPSNDVQLPPFPDPDAMF